MLLAEAGWPLEQDRDREYPVTGMPNAHGKGYVDYVLWGADGLTAGRGRGQAHDEEPAGRRSSRRKLYADCLETEFGRRPVIFYTNGYEHWVWDDAAFGGDGYASREVQGFYTREELELMIQRRSDPAGR